MGRVGSESGRLGPVSAGARDHFALGAITTPFGCAAKTYGALGILSLVVHYILSRITSIAMSLIYNERTKLTQTWFNTMATALMAAGIFAPLAALLYGVADVRAERLAMTTLIVVCVAGGALLHWIGRLILGRLRE